MEKMTVEMPPVKRCTATQCAYNVNQGCHAKAITVGDIQTPDCDTFLANDRHSRDVTRKAGVGACKVIGCRFNEDFECNAGSIDVGMNGQEVRCMTFSPKP